MPWERNDQDLKKENFWGPREAIGALGQEFKDSPWVCPSLAVLSCMGAHGEQAGLMRF